MDNTIVPHHYDATFESAILDNILSIRQQMGWLHRQDIYIYKISIAKLKIGNYEQLVMTVDRRFLKEFFHVLIS